jgi:murein DD-endopeptidase MepM/ murein hydrolase activator NlpD
VADAADEKAAADAAAADAAAKAQADADAQQKAKSDAAASAHAWIPFIDAGYQLTSGFGMRWGSMHPGQDFAVPVGTPVKAMSSGTVIFAGWQGGYGNKVEIQYWDGTVSWFCHNSKLLVKQGENVTPGEVVSMSGNTGHSTGPHVHVEIHPNDANPVPPIPWLTKMGAMP